MSLTPLPLARQRCRGAKSNGHSQAWHIFYFFGNGQRVKSFFNAIFREVATKKKEQPPPPPLQKCRKNMSQNKRFATNATLVITLYIVYIIDII